MMDKTKKINLALQGGGSHGALTWGVLDTLLQDERIEIDSISATSAGSMNAVLLAQGMINDGREGARKALTKFWRDVSNYGKILSPVQLTQWESFLGVTPDNSYSYFLFDFITKILSPYQFNPFNYNPLRTLLEENVDFEQLQSGNHIKLHLSATNVKTGKIKIFKNNEINVDVILASACLPYLSQAVLIDGDYYWNGSYMGNPAIFPLIYESDTRDILVVHLNPIVRKEVPKDSNEILSRVNEISFNSSLIREMRAIAFVTKILENNWIKDEYRHNLKKINMHSIRADEKMAQYSLASKLYTKRDFLLKLFKLGQTIAKEWLINNYVAIGEKTTVDFDEYV